MRLIVRAGRQYDRGIVEDSDSWLHAEIRGIDALSLTISAGRQTARREGKSSLVRRPYSAAGRAEYSRLAKPAAAIHGPLRSRSGALPRPAPRASEAARCEFSARPAATSRVMPGFDNSHSISEAPIEPTNQAIICQARLKASGTGTQVLKRPWRPESAGNSFPQSSEEKNLQR